MTYSMNFLEELAKRNIPIGNVFPLLNDQATSDEAMAVNAAKSSPTSEEVEERTVQPSALSIGVKEPEKFKARTIDPNFNPADIPTKKWLSFGYLLCGYLCLLIAPGATGKSILTMIEAISIALGRDLLQLGHVEQGNVLLINNEDDYVELDRRIHGVCVEYKLDRTTLVERLRYYSGYGNRVIFADEGAGNTVEATNEVNQIISYINEKDIKLLIVDPFISTHTSDENNNSKIDQVIQVYRRIAIETNVAIRIVHHTPKGNNNKNGGAGDIDMARGAGALKDGARVAHTLFPMSDDDAKQYGMDWSEQLRYVRLDDAKTNFTLKTGRAKWLYKKSVYLANGEEIGVLVPRDLETKVLSKEEKAEKCKSDVIHDIGQAALKKLGSEGGIISCPDLLAEYINLSGYAKSKANTNFGLLPLGSVKKELIKPYGKAYRIYQTKEDKKTATRYVHIEPDY